MLRIVNIWSRDLKKSLNEVIVFLAKVKQLTPNPQTISKLNNSVLMQFAQ